MMGKRPNKGFYYISVYANSKISMLANPSFDKHWQWKFFFLNGAWKNEQGLAIRRNFAKTSCSLHKLALHGGEEVERIRMIVNPDAELRKLDEILTYG